MTEGILILVRMVSHMAATGTGGFVALCVSTPSCLSTANVHCFLGQSRPSLCLKVIHQRQSGARG